MTPLDKLVALAPVVGAMHHPSARDMQRKLDVIIAELRAQMAPTDSPFDESAPANSQHFKTWVAVMDALDATGFDWRPRTPQTCAKDAAVAAIRSMAAQCSAQPPVADERSAGVPPLGAIWIDALGYAAGFLHAHDRVAIARELRALGSWLAANAPQE